MYTFRYIVFSRERETLESYKMMKSNRLTLSSVCCQNKLICLIQNYPIVEVNHNFGANERLRVNQRNGMTSFY